MNELIEKIRKKSYAKKDSSEYIIANFILENMAIIDHLTLTEFAKKCYCSKPSVIRFCNALGLDGFSELHYMFKKEKPNYEKPNQSFQYNKNIVAKDFLIHYKEIYDTSFTELLRQVEQDNFVDDLIEKILKCNTIYIFCFNLSYNATRNFVQRVRWIKKNIVIEHDINSISSYIDLADENDMVICISLSGQSPYINKITSRLPETCYKFGVFGLNTEYDKLFHSNFYIPNIENDLWDIYSIRAQILMLFWDYLYFRLNKIYVPNSN